MLDGVFHQGLQHHRRQFHLAQVLRYLNLQVQACAHTDFQDVEVGARPFQLRAQGRHGLLRARQRMAQIQNQVAQHFIGAHGVAAREQLRAGQRVVQEVRLDLRMQQAQLGHREFLFRHRLARFGLLAAAPLRHPARDRARHRFRVFQVAAMVDEEPVGPGIARRLADQGHAARLAIRRDGGEDLVRPRLQESQQAHAGQTRVRVRRRPAHASLHLEAVPRAFNHFAARQFADGRVDHVEHLARLKRDLDLAPLAARQGAGVDGVGDQAHAAHVRKRIRDDGAGQQRADDDKEAFRVSENVAQKGLDQEGGGDDVGEHRGQGEAENKKEAGHDFSLV